MQLKLIISIFISVFILNFYTQAQNTKKTDSLDDFFAGFPLKKGFNAWVDYMAAHPYFGIDSIGDRGGYSSFKPGMKNHFPFPDSVFVKILLSKDINPATNDTAMALTIEGIFGNNKKEKKSSQLFYNQLKNQLNLYYKKSGNRDYELVFSKGINDNFPDCTLINGYFPQLDFYYVLLRYEYLKGQ